ncbi:hypothetical protein [Serratia sp. (in: enterobacteria)]|uniref:hypothetical protein n=1 Tax=Serratia sp. (in: enterobacteria) TaxID=616 RepID=UPI003988D560
MKFTGKINEPSKMTVTSPGDWTQTKGPVVNLRVALDGKSASFTPSENGLYEFRCSSAPEAFEVQVGGTAPEPQPIPDPDPDVPPTPEPTPQEGILWDSNINGKWNDGNKREITVKQGSQQPDDKSIFVAASGSPKLVVDGNGVAHLVAGSGGVDNLSLKLRSRHQEGGDCANRFGGHGCAIDSSTVDFKTETCHNEHTGSKSFNHGVNIGTSWHRVDFTCKDTKVSCVIDGKKIGEHTVSISHGTKEKCDQNSYFWIRLNNSDHGRIYVMAKNYNSKLSLDFMFEPSKNSIALRNVRLVAV